MSGSEDNDASADFLMAKLHLRHVAATWNEEAMKVKGGGGEGEQQYDGGEAERGRERPGERKGEGREAREMN